MRVSTLLVALGSVALLTGCAGQKHAQALKQLESDLGLLDQRVTQLERASLTSGASSSTSWSSETGASTLSTAPAATVIPVQPTVSTPAPSLKPTKKEIQQALKNAGFYQGAVDGKIGPQTREAIRNFQQVNGLKVDGVVGKQTWSKLSAYLDLSAGSTELGAAEILK